MAFAATASKRGARADMDKPAINVAKELARLSALTIFELRGEWRRLHRMPPPMRLSRPLDPRDHLSASGAGVRRPFPGHRTEAGARQCRSADEEPPYRVLLLASWNIAQKTVYGDTALRFDIPK